MRPNRVTLYLTAVVNVTATLVSLLAGLDGPQVATVVAGLVAINGLAVMFLKGWQQYEAALYQDELLRKQQAALVERAAAAQQVGRAGSRKPGITVPGR